MLASSVVEGLAVGSYTLTLSFAEGEEAAVFKVEDSVSGAGPDEVTTLATAPGTITATIVDDTGSPINLSGDADVALMSYQDVGNHVVYDYDFTISLSGLDTSEAVTNTLTVTLPVGMRYTHDTTAKLLAANLTFAGHVASSNYEGRTTLGDYTFVNGTFTFVLNPKVEATSVTIPIKFDPTINTDTITNAVRVTLSDGTASTSQTLEKVTRATDSSITLAGAHAGRHSGSYWLFTGDNTFTMPDACRYFNMQAYNSYSTFIESFTVTVKLGDTKATTADPKKNVRAQLINTDTTEQWKMVSGANDGEYVFTYTPSEGYIRSDSLIVPFDILFPASVSPAWVENDPITVTYVATGTSVNYLQLKENDPLVPDNIGSTVSATASTRSLNTNYIHYFQYKAPTEEVFVNYASNTAYLASDSNPANGSLSYNSNTYNANESSVADNDNTGVLGYFTMGNAGSLASEAKTVEMHFDSTSYGVMALYVPYPAGETLVEVSYTSKNQTSWKSVTVNGEADGRAKVYLSYAMLGISDRNDFITGIKYDFGVIPADTFYVAIPGDATRSLDYYGKWIATNNSAATPQATIAVYDTTDATRTTGTGTVSTSRVDTHAAGFPNYTVSVDATAGETLQFNVAIPGTAGNTPRGNASTEHPVLYIRQEIVDEKSEPLPVTNIRLATSGRLSNSIDSSKLVIDDWRVDASGNIIADTDTTTAAVARIYEIDTKNLPASQVALLASYINSSGALTNVGFSLIYQVDTTAQTPTDSKFLRDMVYVFDRNASTYNTSSGIRLLKADSTNAETALLYKGVRGADSSGTLVSRSTQSSGTYSVQGVQSIHVTSQIKGITGSWTNYSSGDTPIPVGVTAQSGFQLKTNVSNNAGTTVSATEVYIPIPKVGDNWGGLLEGATELSLTLAGEATVKSVGSGDLASFGVKYGIIADPTDDGPTLSGLSTWYDWAYIVANGLEDQVNCIQISAAGIEDMADLEVILDAVVDAGVTEEGLQAIWNPTFKRDFTSSSGTFKDWSDGAAFGVQSALSAIKGVLYYDADRDGLYEPDDSDTLLDGSDWTLKVYLATNTSSALQEIKLGADLNEDGTIEGDEKSAYEIYTLVQDDTTDPSNPVPVEYLLEVSNAANTTYMFTLGATRAEDSSATAAFVSYGANTFVATDASDTVAKVSPYANAKLVQSNTIVDAATYNIGLTDPTILTWQSANTAIGTVAGTKVELEATSSTALATGTVPQVSPIPGYTFSGWVAVDPTDTSATVPSTGEETAAIAATATESAFGASGLMGFDHEDYYAVFTPNPYTLYFDANSAEATAGTASLAVTFNKAVTGSLPAVNSGAPTRVGYDFKGWSTDPQATAADYTLPATWTTADNETVYAVWAASTNTAYTVEHYKVDSKGSLSSPEYEYRRGTTGGALAYTNKNYAGYTLDLTDARTDLTQTIAAAGTTVLRLYYKATPLTVNYNINGGTGQTPGSDTVYTSESFTPAASSGFSRTGYTFRGWNTAANGSGTAFAAGTTQVYPFSQSVTLYAQWDPAGAGYTIYHHRVDADGNVTATETEARTGITGQTATAAARNYAPSHTFNASYPGTVASAVIAQDGSTALHLYYPVNTYTVTFVNWNGATLASRTGIPYGGGTTAPADPVRTGYTFTGWDRTFTNITSNITVTAQYRINTFTVTFLGYDDVVLQTSTVNYGASVTPPANPTRTGFTFAGWDRPSSAWTNVTANATIRATWDAVVVPPEDDPEPPVTPPTETEVIDTEQEDQGLGSTIPILPGGVPLFGSEGTLSWALLNLILSLVGVALAVILAIVWRRRHKKYSEEDEEHRARLEREGYELEEEEDADRKHTRKLWLIVSMILAIVGVVFFLITEDMSQPMVMLDRWTIGNAIILIIEIVAYRLTLKKPKAYEDEDGQEEPVSV